MINPVFGLMGRLGTMPVLLAPHADLAPTLRQLSTIQDDPTVSHLNSLAAQYGVTYSDRSLFVQVGDTAIIPVHGVLVNRSMWAYSSITGYDYILAAYRQACNDPGIVRIVLDVMSFGGEAHGCFETVELARSIENRKPTLAVVTNACSAAYAMCMIADRIVASPSSYNGSVGVVTMHVDFSKMLENAGITVRFLYAGKHKVDGNPYQPLSDDVAASIMVRIKAFYDSFVAVVARFKPMDAAAVEATEAAVFTAADALKLGLIDAVETPQEAISKFVSGSSGTSMEQQMSQATTQPTPEQQAAAAAAAASAAAATAASAAAAAATPAQATTDADKARAEAASSERARIDAIMNCEEAKGRTSLASHLAFKTGTSVDDAKALLAASNKEEAPKADVPNPLAAAMAATGGGPGIQADTAAADTNADATPANRLLASWSKATGRKVE